MVNAACRDFLIAHESLDGVLLDIDAEHVLFSLSHPGSPDTDTFVATAKCFHEANVEKGDRFRLWARIDEDGDLRISVTLLIPLVAWDAEEAETAEYIERRLDDKRKDDK